MMDVDKRPYPTAQAESAIADVSDAASWLAAALEPEVNGGANGDLPADITDDPAPGDEKFGVHKEILFDFRDYGLD